MCSFDAERGYCPDPSSVVSARNSMTSYSLNGRDSFQSSRANYSTSQDYRL